jgi:uncharacterized membrane protein
MAGLDPLRHHRAHEDKQSTFGDDKFGAAAERFARFFGTAKFITGQTIVVALWVTLNVVGLIHHWDVYPFILLNLLFSTQAAYAAPLILLAQTRQADRDKASEDASAKHRQEESDRQVALLAENTDITRNTHELQQQALMILDRVKDVHDDLAGLTTALTEKGIIDGGPGGDQAGGSGPGGGERGPGPVNLGGGS